MKTFTRRALPGIILGVLTALASPHAVMAQSAAASDTASPTLPKITLTNNTGVLWRGDSFSAIVGATSLATTVRWTLVSDSPDFAPEVHELPVATPYPVSTYANVGPASYTLTPVYLKGDLEVASGAPIKFVVLNKPVVQDVVVSKRVLGASDTEATVSFKLEAEDATSVTVGFGDKDTPVPAVPTGDGLYTATIPVPAATGLYQVRVNVGQPYDVTAHPATGQTVSIVRGPKIVVGSKPKLIDTTGEGVPVSLQFRAVNSVPESVLPSLTVSPKGVKTSKFVATYTLPNGTSVTQPIADPLIIKVGQDEYASLLDQAKAQGLTAPIYRIGVSTYLPEFEDATTSSTTVDLKLGVPWSMPTWTLSSTSANNTVVAPGTLTIQATPSAAYDATAAKTHKLAWTWNVPSSGLVAKAIGDKVRLTVNEPGTYPVTVSVTDDLGNTQTADYSFTATEPTLSVDNVATVVAPPSKRYPVTVILKAQTSSTHAKERVTKYDVLLDGQVVQTGTTSLKPLQIGTAGDHTITVVASSNMGNTAEKAVVVPVAPNAAPSCANFKTAFTKNARKVVTSVAATALCTDTDGKVKRFAWTANGQPLPSTSNRASYQFAACEADVKLEVTATDDSGDSTTYSEVITRGGVSDCTNAGL